MGGGEDNKVITSYKIFVLDSIFKHFKNINKLYNPFNNLITNAKYQKYYKSYITIKLLSSDID